MDDLIRLVAADGDIMDENDARNAVEAVTEGFGLFLPREAALALGVQPPAAASADRGETTIGQFFTWLADRREIEQATAAFQARAVAEAMASQMHEDALKRLKSIVPNDFLALFEENQRGELTEPGGSTWGARSIEAPDTLGGAGRPRPE